MRKIKDTIEQHKADLINKEDEIIFNLRREKDNIAKMQKYVKLKEKIFEFERVRISKRMQDFKKTGEYLRNFASELKAKKEKLQHAL